MEQRVLFTASTFSHIRNFHLPYLKAFQDRGYAVTVACGGAPEDLPYVDRNLPLPLEKKKTSVQNLTAARLLRQELTREPYALVSCHTSLASFFTRLAVSGLRPRPIVVCTVHGYLFDERTKPEKRLVLSGAERAMAPVTDLLLTMNAWDAAYAAAHRLGRETVCIPGMGVDFDALSAASEESGAALRRRLGLGPERFVLLYAAEFSERKSQRVLLHALTELPERAVLLLPGSGALLESCKALAQQLGVAERVIFPGQISGMGQWYAAADAVAASSRSEGLPFNIMEAMYFGLPVVASAVKGHTDLLREGETGLLYPYGDSAACARQLRRLMDEPALAQCLGTQAHQAVRRYALDEVLPAVMAQYDRLLPCAGIGPSVAKK